MGLKWLSRAVVPKVKIPSLKLTASLPLKMNAWKMILSFRDGLFSGVMLV